MPTNEERREVAQRIRKAGRVGYYSHIYGLVMGENVPRGTSNRQDEEALAKRLADLIEPENVPEYAEWPKYEDGTPLKLGDELDFGDTCYKRARKVSFTENGVFISNQGGSAERVITLRKGERLSKKIK